MTDDDDPAQRSNRKREGTCSPSFEQPGTGIYIPQHVWAQAKPLIQESTFSVKDRQGNPKHTLISPIALRLHDGRIIRSVVLGHDRQIQGLLTLIPNDEILTSDGIDFSEDDIEAIGIDIPKWGGLRRKMKWSDGP